MAEPEVEVEDILRDIRRRVLDGNGVKGEGALGGPLEHQRETDASDVRIKAYLAATDRLRSSLPPVTTYRRGGMAKVELWFKGKIKRASRWFVFDQLSFNSTVHQILCELREGQIRQEKILSALESSTQLECSREEQRQNVVSQEQEAIHESLKASTEE